MEHDHFTQVLHISRSLKLGAKKKVKFDGEMLAGSAELELKISDGLLVTFVPALTPQW